MPYIIQEKRDRLDSTIDALHKILVDIELDDDTNNMEGNLNYIVTRLIRKCYGQSYGEMNDAIGMLSCVMLEHYRTIVAPYEKQKEFENGGIEIDTPKEILSEVVVRKESDDGAGC